jgi:hypothetical protein
MVKKTIELNQDYIDRAASSSARSRKSKAVNRALEMVVIDDEIVEAHEAVGGKGRLIEEVFE